MTQDEIDKQYNITMMSVDVINKTITNDPLTSDDVELIMRNAYHVRYMRFLDIWTTEDLSPLDNALSIAFRDPPLEPTATPIPTPKIKNVS